MRGSKLTDSEYLGDGAYISQQEDGDFVLTGNHHDPNQATDAVYVEPLGAQTLIQWLASKLKGQA